MLYLNNSFPAMFFLSPASGRKSSVSSVEEMLTSYYDIASAPSQTVLGKLAGYATVSKDRERLLDLANNNGLYQKWQRNNSEGVIEVLNEFPSIEVSLSNMIDVLDTMLPRWYGLASYPEPRSSGERRERKIKRYLYIVYACGRDDDIELIVYMLQPRLWSLFAF